jgi:hypothetical protein
MLTADTIQTITGEKNFDNALNQIISDPPSGYRKESGSGDPTNG